MTGKNNGVQAHYQVQTDAMPVQCRAVEHHPHAFGYKRIVVMVHKALIADD